MNTPRIVLSAKLCFCDALIGHSESTWWYLSYCQSDRPKGQQFVGACIVRGCCIIEAARESHRQRCSPGGEVAGWPSPEPKSGYANRLLTREEIEKAYGDPPGSAKSIGELESEAA